jgi:BirA family biotin operon repressor/biotin-[acetyl-CoA-carboxylase] ligase
MHVIKLSATDSTNAYLKQIAKSENLPDFTVVHTDHQTAGRGQRGTKWDTEAGKNLTFSVLKLWKSFPALRHFMLNACISISIYNSLQALEIPRLYLKWPNDILSGTQKLCGILVENQVRGKFISSSVIGIGLNLNQMHFPNLPGATSLKSLTGRDYDRDKVLFSVLQRLESDLASVDFSASSTTLEEYEAHLYLKNLSAKFRRPDGTSFEGKIQGVSPEGQLQIEMTDSSLESFGFKEVRYPSHAP